MKYMYTFHFLNCLMIVVLQKNSMRPRGRSLNSMNQIYIYLIYIIIIIIIIIIT